MNKKSVSFKLSIYFFVCLVVFTLIISTVFSLLFKNYSYELSKNELKREATNIAASLAGFQHHSEDTGKKNGNGGGGGYLALLKAIYSLYDVWIIDENYQITLPPNSNCLGLTFNELPKNGEDLIKKAFQNETAFNESFSDLQHTPTITVATPISSNQQIVGVVLLHSPIEGINNATEKGYQILFLSLLISAAFSMLVAIYLSKKFSKPLKEMSEIAYNMADGDYETKVKVENSSNEMHDLSSSLNILSDRLLIARQESENLDKLRKDFIANISHELKTPVTVIRGSLESLCDEVVSDPTKVKEYHHQMLQESKFLERLILDLLDLSKLQNIDFKIEKEKVNLADVINDAIHCVSIFANEKSVTIEFIKSDDYTVMGDYGRIRQLMIILFNNAIKFSPLNEKIEIVLKEGEISISDYGIGISKTEIEHIFDRFYKSRNEQNKDGSGLGLAIAKEICLKHDFSISVENNLPKGAKFIIMYNLI